MLKIQLNYILVVNQCRMFQHCSYNNKFRFRMCFFFAGETILVEHNRFTFRVNNEM
jgi:hypothetical protein